MREELTFAIFHLPFRGRDEFLPLAGNPSFRTAWVRPHDYKGNARVIILPGSGRTIDDLQYLRAAGGERIIRQHLAGGGRLLLICGGMQICGHRLVDSALRQGSLPEAQGLGLLPLSTWFGPSMLECRTQMKLLVGSGAGSVLTGEEHRSGYSLVEPDAAGVTALAQVVARGDLPGRPKVTPSPAYLPGNVLWQPGSEVSDGLVSNDRRIWCTYLHLICHNPAFLASFCADL